MCSHKDRLVIKSSTNFLSKTTLKTENHIAELNVVMAEVWPLNTSKIS